MAADLRVQHEAAFAREGANGTHEEGGGGGGGGGAGRTAAAQGDAIMAGLCREASPALRAYAEGLYAELVLPHVARYVNESPDYADLRNIFYWRIVSEVAMGLGQGGQGRTREGKEGRAREGKEGRGGRGGGAKGGIPSNATAGTAGMDGAWPEQAPVIALSSWDPVKEEGWSKEAVFDAYVTSATIGEFNLKRKVREGGVTFVRTYFHGGFDWRTINAAAWNGTRWAPLGNE